MDKLLRKSYQFVNEDITVQFKIREKSGECSLLTEIVRLGLHFFVELFLV